MSSTERITCTLELLRALNNINLVALEESVNGMPGMPSSKLLALLEAGKIAVGDICHDYGQNGHYKKRFIRKAEEEWNRRYEDQETVRTDDSHVDRIVAALARMPRARRIVITDDYRRHRFFDLFKDREPKLYPKQWIFDNIGSARHSAVDFLIKIPCALGAAGIFPIQYFVEFTSLLDLPDLHVSESQRRQISLCMQRVKEICFLSAGLEDGFARVPTTQNHGLISAYIDTNSIEDLALSFEETLMDDSATHSLHAILPSPTAVWPQLRTLFLGDTVSVHWDTELLPMFERHPRIKTVGFRRVCLISGKWRDCFNFLRGLKLKDFSAHRCRGAEMDGPLGEGPDGEELVEDNFCDQLFSFDIQQYVTRKTNGNPFVVDGGRSNPKYFEFL